MALTDSYRRERVVCGRGGGVGGVTDRKGTIGLRSGGVSVGTTKVTGVGSSGGISLEIGGDSGGANTGADSSGEGREVEQELELEEDETDRGEVGMEVWPFVALSVCVGI